MGNGFAILVSDRFGRLFESSLSEYQIVCLEAAMLSGPIITLDSIKE